MSVTRGLLYRQMIRSGCRSGASTLGKSCGSPSTSVRTAASGIHAAAADFGRDRANAPSRFAQWRSQPHAQVILAELPLESSPIADRARSSGISLALTRCYIEDEDI
ncbi:hypothetical protein FVE85_5646 [Porphyridium purpureum]|uniref:Uncharacterized protein n=1 Tax=Porphyridium purpureum TaxID=35688 RepID=A0A5J4Z2I9_PORPP|nr:hypothetical protein FVE85_5646 [Porphyridium purpureum]|eukprot:POR7617..scf295_1